MNRVESKLFNLIKNNESESFIHLFFNVDDLNQQVLNDDGKSLLGEAVNKESNKIIETLINENKDSMYFVDQKGNLPLAYLGITGINEDIVELFNEAGFDFYTELSSKGNILHMAAVNSDATLFEKIMKLSHKDLMFKNKNGETPLSVAKRWCNDEVVDFIEEMNNNSFTM